MTTKKNPAPPASGHGAITDTKLKSHTTAGGKIEGRRHRTARPVGRGQRINFDDINRAALANIGGVLARLLRGGRIVGGDWEASRCESPARGPAVGLTSLRGIMAAISFR